MRRKPLNHGLAKAGAFAYDGVLCAKFVSI